jgi:uncharacterized protein YnzC (UPF0291/DUF896 family)
MFRRQDQRDAEENPTTHENKRVVYHPNEYNKYKGYNSLGENNKRRSLYASRTNEKLQFENVNIIDKKNDRVRNGKLKEKFNGNVVSIPLSILKKK